MPRPVLSAALVLCSLIFAGAVPVPAQQKASGQGGTLRTDVDVVSVYFTVRDGKNRLMPDLKQEDFQVYEDGREQAIRYFAHHADVPLNVGILLDTSTAMRPLLATESDAATYFLQAVMRRQDFGFAVSYNSRVEVLQVPTEQVGLRQDKIAGIRRFGRYDTPPPAQPRVSVPQTSPFPMPMIWTTSRRCVRECC